MNAARLVVAVTIAASGLAAPAVSAAPVALAGENRIEISRTAYVDVRVPRQVSLKTPFGGGAHIGVSGGAPLAAFVLAGRDARNRHVTLAGGGTTVAGHTERFLMPVPVWPMLGGGTYEDVKTYGETTVVPAGTYRLYTVGTGRAVITLRMPGLTGRRAFAPRQAATGAVLPPDHAVSGNQGVENVFVGSDIATLRKPGFALHVLQAHLERETAWQLVMCHNNPSVLVEPVKAAPACPTGEKHTLVSHRYPSMTPDWKLFAQGFAGLPPGEHGVSAVYTSESYTTAIGYSTVWLEY